MSRRVPGKDGAVPVLHVVDPEISIRDPRRRTTAFKGLGSRPSCRHHLCTDQLQGPSCTPVDSIGGQGIEK